MSDKKAELLLEDMTDDELKDLYRESEQRSKAGAKWLEQYGKRNRDNPFEYKDPYWQIQYTCKDILGDRAIE